MHAETVDELLDWPWKRFETFYDSFMRRSLVETLERRKENMIAALWSNSGFEGKEGADARRSAISELEEAYDSAVERIFAPPPGEEHEEDEDPFGFFEAGKRGMKKVMAPRNDEGTVAMAIASDYEYETDQD